MRFTYLEDCQVVYISIGCIFQISVMYGYLCQSSNVIRGVPVISVHVASYDVQIFQRPSPSSCPE